jgi:hypothetical protein
MSRSPQGGDRDRRAHDDRETTVILVAPAISRRELVSRSSCFRSYATSIATPLRSPAARDSQHLLESQSQRRSCSKTEENRG